jgi:hypothetical protein
MSIDFDAITVALALRFDPSTVTPPTGGYDNIRVSTGNLPNQMTPLPTVLVFPENGTLTYVPSKRDSDHIFVVRFYYNQTGDLARDTVSLRKWLTVLVDQLKNATQLGGTVTYARVEGYTVGTFTYAGLEYSGVELTVHVKVNEAWAAVA